MQRRRLGRTDIHVSVICLGSMTWGQQNTEAEAHEQLDYAIGQGINFIDTAEMYPAPPVAATQGRTETYLGNWLSRRPRDDLVIASKVAGPGRRDWIRQGRTDLTPDIGSSDKPLPGPVNPRLEHQPPRRLDIKGSQKRMDLRS